MSQYFIESKSKQPTFFSFNRVIQNQEIDLDFDLFIKEFQENYEKEQQENWLKFWNIQGEEHVLHTWNEKYKEYLKEDKECEESEDKGCSRNKNEENSAKETESCESNCNKEEEAKLVTKAGIISQEFCESDIDLAEKLWEDLWHKHREKLYCEQYLTLTTIFYNYFLDLKKSCEFHQPIAENLEDIKEQEVEFEYENLKLSQELEQLHILGLPTSFGGRQQNSNKKHKKNLIHYSDFFSDSEMENDSNESDMEDSDINKKEENSLHYVQEKSSGKVQKRKRNRKLKSVPSFILEEKGLLKYWRKRFSLFSRFDEGIRLDRESWFSVTPEKVAKHLAERLKCNIIVDGFCGSGGNVIQFALTCEKVIAIDIDPVKLEMAKHNAEIYKVSHKIEFILGDFLQLAAGGKLKADIVFLSPPWGGPKYKSKKEFDIEKYLLPVKASELVEASRNVSKNIALFLPRNSSVKQIVKLAGAGNRCEIEHNYLDSRLVAITALYGEEILTKRATN